MIESIPNPPIFGMARKQFSLKLPVENHELALSHPLLDGIPVPETIERSVPKRKLQFLAGRACAGKALELEGVKGSPEIHIGPKGNPVWPKGFVGSITHLNGLASAVVARSEDLLGLGMDVEEVMSRSLAEKIAFRISTASELRACFECCPDWPPEQVVTLCFSAKESAYKCLSPLIEGTPGFHSFGIGSINPVSNVFCIYLTVDFSKDFPIGTPFFGKFNLSGKRIHTSLEIRHAPPPTGSLS